MKIKSIWSSIVGGVTSAFPILFAACKGGACVGVCVTPVASLFGISAATIAASPLTSILEPLFIALSAVSFTVSYYSLYVIPKLNCSTGNSCDCGPTDKEKRNVNISKFVFWFGLLLSIGFISYFEYSKYQQSSMAATECSPEGCSAPSEECCASGDSTACAVTEQDSPVCDSTSSCCTSDKNNAMGKSREMTCKLTSPELQKRKATVLVALRKQVIDKKELSNGYAFKFEGSDAMIDKLNEFIKTERQCCDFFTFNLTISGDKSTVWLELTGADGVKDFIKTELEL